MRCIRARDKGGQQPIVEEETPGFEEVSTLQLRQHGPGPGLRSLRQRPIRSHSSRRGFPGPASSPGTGSNQPRLNKKALLLVLTGPVLSLLGFLLILNLLDLGSQIIALSGLLILLIGLLAIMETIGLGPTYLRYWRRGYWGRGGRFMGKHGSYGPRPKEVEV